MFRYLCRFAMGFWGGERICPFSPSLHLLPLFNLLSAIRCPNPSSPESLPDDCDSTLPKRSLYVMLLKSQQEDAHPTKLWRDFYLFPINMCWCNTHPLHNNTKPIIIIRRYQYQRDPQGKVAYMLPLPTRGCHIHALLLQLPPPTDSARVTTP